MRLIKKWFLLKLAAIKSKNPEEFAKAKRSIGARCRKGKK